MIGAIVLAAGGSSRMGRAKQLIEIDGESLIRRATIAAIDAELDPIIVVLGASATACAAQLDDLGVIPVVNAQWQNGMGSSLRTGVEALLNEEPDVDAIVALVCDQPHLDARILRVLVETWSRSRKAIAACAYSDSVGVPACFARSVFPNLRAIGDDQGARHVIRGARSTDVVTVPWPEGAVDFDTPDDIKDIC